MLDGYELVLEMYVQKIARMTEDLQIFLCLHIQTTLELLTFRVDLGLVIPAAPRIESESEVCVRCLRRLR